MYTSINVVAISSQGITSTTDINMVPIPGLRLSVNAKRGDKLHVVLTVSDTWHDTVGAGTWFEIVQEGVGIISNGITSSGSPDQRVPITLQAVVDVGRDGPIDFWGGYHVWNNGTSYLGATCPRRLVVTQYSV